MGVRVTPALPEPGRRRCQSKAAFTEAHNVPVTGHLKR